MARTIRDSSLETRAARERLAPRGKPYYRAIEPKAHLGYRKTKGRRGQRVAGSWVVRLYIGEQAYRVEKIGVADDYADADGVAVLSFKQAQDIARQRLKAMANQSKEGPVTVATAIADHLTYLETNKKSAKDARYKAEAFILPTLGHLEVAKLASKVLRQWLNGLVTAPARLRTKPGQKQRHRPLDDSPEGIRRRKSTANRILSILKAALTQAFKDNESIESDGAWRRVDPFEGVDAARVRYLTIEESLRLANAAEPEFRPVVTGALLTGARYGELAVLRVHDFNDDSETVHVQASKGGKGRHIELAAEGVAFFRSHCQGRAGDAAMFIRDDGERWGTAHQNRRIRKACEAAKIAPPLKFHELRHTWASHAVMNGVPLMVVARNLGHVDTRMVEKHYGHLAPSYVRDAIREKAPRFGIKTDPDNVTPIGSRRA